MIKNIIKWIKKQGCGLIVGAIATFIGCYCIPLAEDVYRLTLGQYYSKIVIDFYSVSTTTLEPLNKYRKVVDHYEITTFKIVNSGKKRTERDNRIKIQAGGQIFGITPKELNERFKIDPSDNTVGYLNIGSLNTHNVLSGAIHSFSKLYMDKNEAQIGIDPIGNFELNGPLLLLKKE